MRNINEILAMLGIAYMMSQKHKKNSKNDLLEKHMKNLRADQSTDIHNTYINKKYGIKFQYPSGWIKNPNYTDRYDGKDGFFEILEITEPIENIDQVVYQNMVSPVNPYGKTAQVRKLTIQGKEARLIIPPTDKNITEDYPYSLIVKNEQPMEIGDQYSHYIEIWADKGHIDEIIDSFIFI